MKRKFGFCHFQLKPKNLKSELILYFTVAVTLIITLLGVASCYWIGKYINERNTDSTLDLLKQIDHNFKSELSYVQNLSYFIISNNDVREYLTLNPKDQDRIDTLFDSINRDFTNFGNANSDIISISIYGKNSLKYETVGYSETPVTQIQLIENSLPKNGVAVLTPLYQRNYSTLSKRYVLSFMRRINDTNHLKNELGTMRIDLDESELESIYKNINLGNSGYFFVADENGSMVSVQNKSNLSLNVKQDPTFAPAYANQQGTYRKTIHSQDMMISYYTSSDGRFRYFGIVPYQEMSREIKIVQLFVIFIAAISTLLAIVISYLISVQITTPIKRLSTLAVQVEKGNLDVISNINRSDELGVLSKALNNLIAKMKVMIEEQYADQLEKEQMKLKVLQNQINPHFLYNTLDVIYWTARVEKALKTSEIADALSQFFKLGLNHGNEITTVEKEVQHLNSYLVIQKMRYDYELDIAVNIDPSLDSCEMIKLILQPVVENAILHGISSLGEEGQIRVTGGWDSEDILFTVEDNGIGMPESVVSGINSGSFDQKQGFGLRNVNERIKLYYGEKYGITVFSKPNCGTKIEIRISKAPKQEISRTRKREGKS